MMDGLKIIRTIQSTDRFDAYAAEYEGQKVFAKKAKAEKPRELLARVPANSKAADQMGQKTSFKFRTPKVIKQDDDWLVTEWIEGQPLGGKVKTDTEGMAEILANFLLIFDREPVVNGEIRKTFKSNSLSDYMVQKLPKDLDTSQKAVLDGAKKLFDELQPTLTPSWQDGDIRPDHIFVDPKNPTGFVLVDPEHLDPRWPRFYSLANNFVKFWVRGPKEFSKELARLFIDKTGISEQEMFRPFLACVIVRGISLHWEPEYDPGGKEFNIPRAQEVLGACLAANNLDDLLY